MRASITRFLPKSSAIQLAAGLLALSALVAPAFADSYHIGEIEFTNGAESDNITYDNPNHILGTITDYGQGMGELSFIGTDTTTHKAATLDVWCIDIYHNVYLGNSNNSDYTAIQGLLTDNSGHYGSGGSNGTGVALTQLQINEMSWLVMTGTEFLNSHPGDSHDSAAYQLAIWEAEYTLQQGFSANGNSPLELTAATLVGDAAAASAGCHTQSGACWWDNGVFRLDSADSQGFAYWDGAVPEPGSLGLLGGALLGLAGVTMLRRRKLGAQV